MGRKFNSLEGQLQHVAERQEQRRELLRQELESNPDILLPLLSALKEFTEQPNDPQLSPTSEKQWIDLLAEDNPQLSKEQLEEIANVT